MLMGWDGMGLHIPVARGIAGVPAVLPKDALHCIRK